MTTSYLSIESILAFPHQGGYRLFEMAQIVHCESDGNYTFVFLTTGERVMVCRKLKEIEAVLPTHSFVRIHHSHMVNLRFVIRYLKEEGGQVELTTGKKLNVARRKRQALFDKLVMV